MAYEHDEIGDFASERDAQDWAERNNIDPSESVSKLTLTEPIGVT